ncbi:MAG: cation-transporting P-type ATPase [Pseudonocardia sp.]|uniref:cation-translocating P-type ATPase n=1 Tax=unclassified Pseudonocardia TaxID=2619320 RepID=UPI00086DE219|nr:MULTISPECIES: cation-transporting P-type ATPase [unclassified Pseudonocardia]MBN9110774.1 cation-transporting P-type ATPase [Pseudonocardia sp.]ODU27145.1 MAG: magnesium-transporting ATPase [Pseudonocardia sp. SCN 72-51]ODV04468.1 MAG: magnesium-transporting ATPase [Pseudonocardia sp. SCN 73-27]
MPVLHNRTPVTSPAGVTVDPREPVTRLLRDLRVDETGLSAADAARRLERHGPNVLPRAARAGLLSAVVRQFTHPLALLLLAAAVLAAVSGTTELAWAILAVVVLNAVFALVQERQAGRAVDALGRYLPPHARVRRDGAVLSLAVAEIVPGDIVLLGEGDRVPADCRLVSGALEVDAAALTGESAPVDRDALALDRAGRALDSPVLVWSGTACVGGSAEAVVHATGSDTEIGRIAALTRRRGVEQSPLERQVRRVAYLIAAIAVGVGIAFLPLGVMAGLSWTEAVIFAVGLLVANVPEGLLPTITLALAGGVRALARRGALVKRLSAVETLGSTTVICTDKTGTLTAGEMSVQEIRDSTGAVLDGPGPELVDAVVACSTADLAARIGDPTELALLEMAAAAGADVRADSRDRRRRALFAFDPRRRAMSTLDAVADGHLRVHVKGAPEFVIPRCGKDVAESGPVVAAIDEMTGGGLRVLAVAARDWPDSPAPGRDEAEASGLRLLGLVGLLDPPRPEVPAAVEACHSAGIRVHVVTGDNGRTAAEIARRVGLGVDRVVDASTLDTLPTDELKALLAGTGEIVFARTAPETKLRIADALRADGHTVAMTGDGVNDAPALHHADIGVAMGRGGTDVAREAATMILTDDNFATVVAGVEEGRRVYDNVRKFVLYIFAHAVPEVVPFLLFALSGGLVPLPLTVLQILAVDLGTETLPALALGRERAEPGLMERRPRRPGEGVVDRRMLVRAWALMGTVSAVLGVGLFLLVLVRAGWTPGADTSTGSPLHHGYLQATTASFAAIVACQVGTAFAARTDRTSLRRVGLTSNRMLLWGIAFELAFAAALVYVPPLQDVFGTAALPVWVYPFLLVMPVIVWGADELFRWAGRRRDRGPAASAVTGRAGSRAGTHEPGRASRSWSGEARPGQRQA